MKRIGYVLAACLVSGNIVMAQTTDKAESREMTQDMEDDLREQFLNAGKGVNFEIADEIRKLVEDNLKVGASSIAIEDFLQTNFGRYTYDRFANRYWAIVRNVENDSIWIQDVVILIFLDEKKSFIRAEVSDAFR